jgi:hypothetical protein
MESGQLLGHDDTRRRQVVAQGCPDIGRCHVLIVVAVDVDGLRRFLPCDRADVLLQSIELAVAAEELDALISVSGAFGALYS